MEKEKAERTVVHVELFADNSHHYFGSLAAIYEKFSKEEWLIFRTSYIN